MMVWTGFIRFRVGTSVGLLQTPSAISSQFYVTATPQKSDLFCISFSSKLFELSDPCNTICGNIMANDVTKVSKHKYGEHLTAFSVMYPQHIQRQTDSWMHRAEKH